MEHAIELRVDDINQRFTGVRVRGAEALSRVYRFDVDILTSRRVPFDADALVGRDVTLSFSDRDGPRRRVRGVVSAQRVSGHPVAGDRMQYRLRVVPRLATLRRRRTSRIFQDRTALEAVGLVLHRARVAFRSEVEAALPPLEYCVQYRETDLAFVERILAEHGIAYWFEHPDDPADDLVAPDGELTLPGMEGYTVEGLRAALDGLGAPRRRVTEVMVLCDAARRFPRLAAPPGREALETPHGRRLAFGALLEGDALSDVHEFAWRSAARVTEVHQVGYDPLHPTARPEARAATFDPTRREARTAEEALGVEVFLHRDEYGRAQVERRSARVELERRRRRAAEGEGASRCAGLFPGARVVLEGHPLAALDRPYLVTAVTHEVVTPELREAHDALDAEPLYRNTFRCVTADTPWRPPLPPRRVQQVMETAVVVGPEGEAVHTDAHGRVRVRFQWDDADASRGDTSCWIRVAHPWAGDGHGALFLPRVGSEVLVAFLDGDTDRPVVVGGLYNGAHAPPWPLPGERTRQGLRGRSVGAAAGSERHNEIAFEDRAGAETLELHAARDLLVTAERHRRAAVRGDDHVRVEGARAVEVSGELRERFAGHAWRVYADDLDERVEGDVLSEVQGDARHVYVGDRVATVACDQLTEVHGDHVTRVDHDHVTRTGGDHVVQVGAPDAPRTLTLFADDRADIAATDTLTLKADAELVLRCGDSMVRLTPERVEIVGEEVIVTGDGAVLSLRGGVARVRAASESHLLGDRVLLRAGQGAAVGLSSAAEILASELRIDAPGAGTPLTDDPTPPPTRFELRDQEGRPVPYARYVITLEDGSTRAGVLDGDGRAELELDQGGEVRFEGHPGAQAG